MPDMRDTEHLPPPITSTQNATMAILSVLQRVFEEAQGNMTLPTDPEDRMLAERVMNNLYDRLEEAIRRELRKQS
jgi:hypothetical protein